MSPSCYWLQPLNGNDPAHDRPVRLSAAPVIVTPPGEVYNVSGSQVYLSCEAVGVPTPVLTWKKVSFSVITHIKV